MRTLPPELAVAAAGAADALAEDALAEAARDGEGRTSWSRDSSGMGRAPVAGRAPGADRGA